MLWTPGNSFNWSVDNFGSTYTDVGLGQNCIADVSANVKGANTSMLVGIAEDCYGILIGFSGESFSATIRKHLVDLLIDPAAGIGGTGASWSVAIANLYASSATFGSNGAFGYWYYFPLYLKAGTAIGASCQGVVGGTQLRVIIRILGKPTRPELLQVGTRVQTIGANTASTDGVAVTPGTSAIGSYSATLGTTSSDAWWWQLGIGSNDTSMQAQGYLFDVAANATNKIICAEGIVYVVVGSTEQASKSAFGTSLPVQAIASGQDVYVRGACVGTPDSSMSAVVYALGG